MIYFFMRIVYKIPRSENPLSLWYRPSNKIEEVKQRKREIEKQLKELERISRKKKKWVKEVKD